MKINKSNSQINNLLSPKKLKKLILQKIDLKTNNEYNDRLNKIFNDPNCYLDSKLEGNLVIVGKRNQIRNNVITFQPKRSIIRRSIFLKKLNMNTLNNLDSLTLKKTLSLKSRSTNRQNNNLKENQKYINDDELNNIYNKFKLIQAEHKIKKDTNIDPDLYKSIRSKSVKNKIKEIFKQQEDFFSNSKKNIQEYNNLKENISKKINRPIDKLLITKSESFRINNELKSKISNEIINKKPKPLYKWVTELRDNDIHYINVGNVRKPIWQIVREKKNKTSEIIRNPEKINNNSINLFYKTNPYLKSQLSNKTFKEINNSEYFYKKKDNIKLMIKGKNLLEFEMENSKNYLKGKKKILTMEKIVNNNSSKNFLSNLLVPKKINNKMNEHIYVENIEPKNLYKTHGRFFSDDFNFYKS